jgi:hypothetical protein
MFKYQPEDLTELISIIEHLYDRGIKVLNQSEFTISNLLDIYRGSENPYITIDLNKKLYLRNDSDYKEVNYEQFIILIKHLENKSFLTDFKVKVEEDKEIETFLTDFGFVLKNEDLSSDSKTSYFRIIRDENEKTYVKSNDLYLQGRSDEYKKVSPEYFKNFIEILKDLEC